MHLKGGKDLKKVSIRKSLVNLAEIMAATAAGSILKFVKPKRYKDVWMILERGTDARDNGYFFFKWLRENHPEQNAVYVIDPLSADAQKVKDIGRTVPFMSWKHKIIASICTATISTHHNINSPYENHYKWADRLSSKHSKRVMLQHGVTKDDIPYFHYDWLNADLFICSAKPEYEFVKKTFGYPEGNVQYTGFARFDNLLKEHPANKWILLMPTWRKYVVENGVEGFKESLYYKKYQSLLNNNKLIFALRQHGYKLVFYPHYEIQRFLDEFSTEGEDVVKIAAFRDCDVQELLMRSELLITDYSSIYFDFAYMGKPLLYYQFDEKEYRSGHYSAGYFNYRRDGFGPVLSDEESIMNGITAYLDDHHMYDAYQERVQNFFPVRDENNCERIYDAICKIAKSKT